MLCDTTLEFQTKNKSSMEKENILSSATADTARVFVPEIGATMSVAEFRKYAKEKADHD